jgi:uncharacterized protein YqgC (DUF456 family)
MSVVVVLVALAIAIGLAGIVVPLMPGSILVATSILIWAAVQGSAGAWATFAICAGLVAIGTVVKYLVPGRRLAQSDIPTSTLAVGGVLGVVGFFVVPVVGLPLGFVGGIYLAELNRTSQAEAWPATVHALKAVGLGILIELVFGVLAAASWVIGVVAVS